MKDCCEGKSEALACLRTRQGRVLKIVLAINAAMFVVEAVAGLAGRSTSLLADSLDMFGDAAVYGVSLYALDRGDAWRARASLLKGGLMAAFGLGVLGEAAWKALGHGVPQATTMGAVGGLALLANLACLGLLLRHRQDDINMRSTWICSRNDIVANLGILGAAWAVSRVGTIWPDVLVGVAIALLGLTSSVSILREARQALQKSATPSPAPAPAPEPRPAVAHGLITLSRKPLTKSPSV